MQPEAPQIKSFLRNVPTNKKIPRYRRDMGQCVECGRDIGLLGQINYCSVCSGIICDRHNSGFRSFDKDPLVCSHCKANQVAWATQAQPAQVPQQTAVAEAIFNKMVTAEGMLNNSRTVDAEQIINSLMQELYSD